MFKSFIYVFILSFLFGACADEITYVTEEVVVEDNSTKFSVRLSAYNMLESMTLDIEKTHCVAGYKFDRLSGAGVVPGVTLKVDGNFTRGVIKNIYVIGDSGVFMSDDVYNIEPNSKRFFPLMWGTILDEFTKSIPLSVCVDLDYSKITQSEEYFTISLVEDGLYDFLNKEGEFPIVGNKMIVQNNVEQSPFDSFGIESTEGVASMDIVSKTVSSDVFPFEVVSYVGDFGDHAMDYITFKLESIDGAVDNVDHIELYMNDGIVSADVPSSGYMVLNLPENFKPKSEGNDNFFLRIFYKESVYKSSFRVFIDGVSIDSVYKAFSRKQYLNTLFTFREKGELSVSKGQYIEANFENNFSNCGDVPESFREVYQTGKLAKYKVIALYEDITSVEIYSAGARLNSFVIYDSCGQEVFSKDGFHESQEEISGLVFPMGETELYFSTTLSELGNFEKLYFVFTGLGDTSDKSIDSQMF